ncbi:MAG: MG2 domain-containing protein [Phycisphaerae bacterium]
MWAIHTLKDNETIARLANGIKRFKLPDEHNFIKLYREMAEKGNSTSEQFSGHAHLANIYENRRQYPEAVKHWKECRELRPNDESVQRKLEQLTGNWGHFESIGTQQAGKGATVEFRFRNAEKVTFEAYHVKVDKLLDDVKNYLRSEPKELDYDLIRLNQTGYRLVYRDQDQYIGKKAAEWSKPLEPLPHHWDKRVTVQTPLKDAGAYLLVAKMPGGNTTRVLLWLADTAIVKKPLDGKSYIFLADSQTGEPLAKVDVDFFGFRQKWLNKEAVYDVDTRRFARTTDQNGQIVVDRADGNNEYQWIITARRGGKPTYVGYTGLWGSNWYDREYNQGKTFVMTDRPVYRPGQTVKFKFWVNTAKYDREGKSEYAGQSLTVRCTDPRGQELLSKQFVADEFGGVHGEIELGEEATLGVYSLSLAHAPHGGSTFRVEEYKKPEYEVTIEAPEEPVMLGETIKGKVKADYYFGAPVVNAQVTYKITRTEFENVWYPWDPWDWYYGRGYWWFAYEYHWYPGWDNWGCKAPAPWWWYHWGWRPQPQPELVAEVEGAIGPDGTVEFEIDTSLAKAVLADRDHKYRIEAEVTDESRRTIVGTGEIIVARRPFKVYSWIHRGYYRVGDVIQASASARTPDDKPVEGEGTVTLYSITYKDAKPVEKKVESWDVETDADGIAKVKAKAAKPGQYRMSFRITDRKGHTEEGAYIFTVMGETAKAEDFRFTDLELIPQKRNYEPGETVELQINTNRPGSTVLLFEKPVNGVYKMPRLLKLDGRSTVEQMEIAKRDMPNCYVEAVTVHDAQVYNKIREIHVPPEKRVLNVEVTSPSKDYKPGEEATLKVKVTDHTGEPFQGSTVLTLYDKAVEYISGGSNVQPIKEFFWKWRRRHYPNTQSSLSKSSSNLLKKRQTGMQWIGAFGATLADDITAGANPVDGDVGLIQSQKGRFRTSAGGFVKELEEVQPDSPMPSAEPGGAKQKGQQNADNGKQMQEATVRTRFADTALWKAELQTGKDGTAEVRVVMPENLTTWKARVWAMGHGTRVGEGTAEIITTKNLIVRLQAPRFFVQADEVVISANVHNYLKQAKKVRVSLELNGDTLEPMRSESEAHTIRQAAEKGITGEFQPAMTREVLVKADGETRVDWRLRVIQPGTATLTVKALTDEESDAMQMNFPVLVHGAPKMDSFSGVIRPKETGDVIAFRIPEKRKPTESRLELRYSPTLAGAMVDALPYLAEYPYGCTEQTLNRFISTVVTHKLLLDLGLDLDEIRKKRTNLNAQEIGEDVKRAHDWKRLIGKKRWDGENWVPRNPVFDKEEVKRMVTAGLERLRKMQNADGGWGWFSGWQERSYPHTTAVVVHGLLLAKNSDRPVDPQMLQRGIDWLKQYQAAGVDRLQEAEKAEKKRYAHNLDALVYTVLAEADTADEDMNEMARFLYRDRTKLSVYALAMIGVAYHETNHDERRDMVRRNVEQYLVQDNENQTAYLKMPNGGYWWYWYGSEMEAHAWYLKLLARTDPKSKKASRLVKYLINNRRHATYWNSTRDTAYVIEALGEYIRASEEGQPDMTVSVLLDGKEVKKVRIDKNNLFTFDNKFVLTGKDVTGGKHKLEIVKKGTGPLYHNFYASYFTLEDFITHSGLEIKVRRDYYRLEKVDKTVKAESHSGGVWDKKVEKYKRIPLKNLSQVTSGDLVEIELVIESKNDYEYIIFEDMKPAGFEPVQVRSGYTGNEMGAYVEFRDEKVAFFVRKLARGKHSVSYRMRAEIPGKFSALPTQAGAMYAPELRANSDEIKVRVVDR